MPVNNDNHVYEMYEWNTFEVGNLNRYCSSEIIKYYFKRMKKKKLGFCINIVIFIIIHNC